MNPTGSMSLLFLLRYSDFVGNNHTPITMPCIKTKRIAAKTYLKDQQTLELSRIKNTILRFVNLTI